MKNVMKEMGVFVLNGKNSALAKQMTTFSTWKTCCEFVMKMLRKRGECRLFWERFGWVSRNECFSTLWKITDIIEDMISTMWINGFCGNFAGAKKVVVFCIFC